MLKVDPDQRYTLKQVFRHPWMKIGGPDPGFETQIKECEDLEVGENIVFHRSRFPRIFVQVESQLFLANRFLEQIKTKFS